MIMPKYYFYCYQKGSDFGFIRQRMAAIPHEHQAAVANRYEEIFNRGNGWKGRNRKRANMFLHKIARRYRDKAKREQAKQLQAK